MCITIFTRKDSLPCFATKRALKQRGINFIVRCIDDDPELKRSLERQGFSEYPVVMTKELSWSGFRPDMINRLKFHDRAANG